MLRRSLVSLLVLLSLFQRTAAAEPPTRRQFLITCGIGLSALAVVQVTLVKDPEPRIGSAPLWEVPKEYDVEALGLEAFGRTVKEILQTKKIPIAQAERVRWKLQQAIWEIVQTKLDAGDAVQLDTPLAIALEDGTFVHLAPSFRIAPQAPDAAGRTVRKIEYLGTTANPETVTYTVEGFAGDSRVIKAAK